MNIVTVDEGNPYVMQVIGRLDTNSAPKLDDFMSGLYAKGVNDIVMDMKSCDFVSSAGLRVIVTMQKHAVTEGSLVFRNVKPSVMEVFEMTGFDKILTFE